jgi:hypothetical protein
MEAPGTGQQKTGFSNVESSYTGFEGSQDKSSTDVGSSVKDSLHKVKDKLSSDS